MIRIQKISHGVDPSVGDARWNFSARYRCLLSESTRISISPLRLLVRGMLCNRNLHEPSVSVFRRVSLVPHLMKCLCRRHTDIRREKGEGRTVRGNSGVDKSGASAPTNEGGGGHAVVLGASVSGLLAARVLADVYDRVTLIERDLVSEVGIAARRGVPQGRHAHGLLSRGAE